MRVGVSLRLRSRCTFACEHENCASKHTSRAALRSTGPGPPPSRLSSSEQPRAELVAAGWNVPWAKWYAARWNAWNASIDAVVDGVLCSDQEEGRGHRPKQDRTALLQDGCAVTIVVPAVTAPSQRGGCKCYVRVGAHGQTGGPASDCAGPLSPGALTKVLPALRRRVVLVSQPITTTLL